jgi:hypothetical protein
MKTQLLNGIVRSRCNGAEAGGEEAATFLQ